jgi:hypothetical protein
MRFQLIYMGSLVAESEYRDLAETAATNSPVPVTLRDTWTGEDLPVPPKVLTYVIPDRAITDLIDRNQKIMAIRLVREITGWGLAESKAYVDNLHYNRPF